MNPQYMINIHFSKPPDEPPTNIEIQKFDPRIIWLSLCIYENIRVPTHHRTRLQSHITFVMLNSSEQDILSADRNQNTEK